MVSNWLLNNGQPMDTQATFLCGAPHKLHLLSAAGQRNLAPVSDPRPIGDPESPRSRATLG